MSQLNKPQIRNSIRQKIQQISLHQKLKAESNAILHLGKLQSQVSRVALYSATPHEFQTKQIIEFFLQNGKKVYLPRIETTGLLGFYEYTSDVILSKNKFDILEPTQDAVKIPIEGLDSIFLPLIAFDLFGNRLGYGGGYYDRTLASIAQGSKPFLIGLGFSSQKVEYIPTDSWDIPMDAVLTEEDLSFFDKRG